MSEKGDQYRHSAAGWSERQYADATAYLDHRADLVVALGPPLERGDSVLDLACGDGGLGPFLVDRGLNYRGVDSTPEMVSEARRRLGDRGDAELGDLNDYEPPETVQVTTCFRSIYYARDRRELFRRIAGYTQKKLVLDVNPRQFPLDRVRADLAVAGFGAVSVRPFFVPQTISLPRPVATLLRAAELAGPVARLVLRFRFTYVVAAWAPSSRGF